MIRVEKDGTIIATEFNQNIDSAENYYNLSTYYRCWNGGSSNVCSLVSVVNSYGLRIKGQATTNPSAAGYAYVYPYYTTPIGSMLVFSCTIENHHNVATEVSLRIRDGNNSNNLSAVNTYTIQPSEKREVFVKAHTASESTEVTPAFSIYSESSGYVDIEITEISLTKNPVNNANFFKSGEINFMGFNETGCVEGLTKWLPLDNNVDDISESYSSNTPYNISFINGKEGLSASFNGSNSYITLGSPQSTIRSFSMWIKTSSFPQSNMVVFVDYASQSGFGFYSGNRFIVKSGPAATRQRIAEKGNYKDSDWNYIVVTYDSVGVPRVYINGVETTYISDAPNYWTAASGECQIGRRNSGNYFGGQIQHFKLYNRELTPQEVKLEYNTFFSGEVQIDKTKTIYAKVFEEY